MFVGKDKIGQRRPVRRIKIGPGGIVAAAMQHQDIAGFHAGKISHHRIKIDHPRGRIKIGVGGRFEIHRRRHRQMRGPMSDH